MGLRALVDAVAAYFLAREVPATAVFGERARPAQGNARSGSIGGRVSFLPTGKGTYQGPTLLGPRPTDNTLSIPGLLALVNDLRTQRLAHYATAGAVHLAGSSPSLPAAATTLSQAIDVGNALRTAEIAHHASTAAHATADTSHAITAPAASSSTTLRTLALQLQEKGNAHNASTSAHGEADEDHDSTQDDPLASDATSRAVAQKVIEVEAEVWAWDDSAPTDDRAQWEAFLALHEWTVNAIRSYVRSGLNVGGFELDRSEPATAVIHAKRGYAEKVFFKLPIPVHQRPAVTPREVTPEFTATIEISKGIDQQNEPIDPVTITVVAP